MLTGNRRLLARAVLGPGDRRRAGRAGLLPGGRAQVPRARQPGRPQKHQFSQGSPHTRDSSYKRGIACQESYAKIGNWELRTSLLSLVEIC